MLRKETSYIGFRHLLPFGEAKQMVGEDMSWNSSLDPAKCRKRTERRKRAEDRGIEETHDRKECRLPL